MDKKRTFTMVSLMAYGFANDEIREDLSEMPEKVNLDAMIRRADFAAISDSPSINLSKEIKLSSLAPSEPYSLLLRKPDFQRETNQWSPDQIVSLLESFLDSELIPGIVMWRSPDHVFVIDGCHRLSALKAWISADYGDGPISRAMFGNDISRRQRYFARKTADLIAKKIGTYETLRGMTAEEITDPKLKQRVQNVTLRALDVQWVEGNADVAETSFFKINSRGTPLDPTERILLENRKKGIAIAARAVMRAGVGHKYWSRFEPVKQAKIEEIAKELANAIYAPEYSDPIKSLDLPLAGRASSANALSQLVDLMAYARSKSDSILNLTKLQEDRDGADTIQFLKQANSVVSRMVGNGKESLGLVPAVYFYNDGGAHERHLFLGMFNLIAHAIRNNNGNFFKKFTNVRSGVEKFLVDHKTSITLLFANVHSRTRVKKAQAMFEYLIGESSKGSALSINAVAEELGINVALTEYQPRPGRKVSDVTKSQVFLRDSINSSLKCHLCGGYVLPVQSVSYDHDIPSSKGGNGAATNIKMTHPFCNSLKGNNSGIE